MPSWYLKAGIQGILALFPRHEQLNYVFQRYVSRNLPTPQANYSRKTTHARNMLEHYLAYQKKLPERVLEIGTGWQPIIPILFALCDIPEILSIDVKSLMKPVLLHDTLETLKILLENNTLQDSIPHIASDAPQKIDTALRIYNESRSIAATLASLNIQTLITDARTLTPSQVGKFDLIISVNTFEHIPPDVLQGILKTERQLLHEDGLLINHIDLSDHYAHFDSSLTRYNFLRYTPSKWKLFNNALQYQNRLRISDYRQFYQQANFEIISEENSIGSEDEIASIVLSEDFQHYPHEDLIVVYSRMIGRPI